MRFTSFAPLVRVVVLAALLPAAPPAAAQAVIPGLTGATFDLTAKPDYISGADGLSIHIWGLSADGGRAQYPSPTLILDEGQNVTINLTNELPEPVSLVFPGQTGVVAAGDQQGPLAAEAAASGGTATYSFTASRPGTFLYHSGSHPDLQIEMGLVGAIIVRPAGFDPGDPLNRRAYAHADSAYDHEYLFLLTEMDLALHQAVELGLTTVDTSAFFPVYWFINGRNAPDTMEMAGVPWLPTQPYNCMPRMHPGERLLMRVIGGGRDLHPFHTHGNNATIIARDGWLLESAPAAGADLAVSDFTITSVPGQTVDAIFTWTGENLGWDIYGHDAADPQEPGEYAPDHGKPFPVVLPEQQSLTFGITYSGSPFLGAMGALPPGEGGFNANGGFFFMWHSHNEKEMVNNDIFPGGMMTMLIVEPPGIPIP